MQVTRQRIIDLLRKQGQATVEELAQTVGLTPMAVRHHLNVLLAENLITVHHTRRKRKPGRPVQVYSLTNEARKLYPQEYFQLTDMLVEEVARRIGQEGVLNVFNSIADRLIEDCPPLNPDTLPFEKQLDTVTNFLREKGFMVEWGIADGYYTIYHLDCPYRQFSQQHREVCRIDAKLIGAMLNITPRRVSCIACADAQCVYVLSPVPAE